MGSSIGIVNTSLVRTFRRRRPDKTAIKTDKRVFQQGQISRTESWERVYKQYIMFVFLFSIKSLLTDLSVGACVVISQFFGPYQGSGSLFSRSVPWDPCFFCWFNALGRAPGLGHKKEKKNFQNIPQNRLVGKYFYHHDGHILKKWRNTSILAIH